jgi:hypothetical protein
VLKIVFNSFLILLLVATVVWGGCVSCPKFFMFSSHEKSCCKKSGECERPMNSQPAKEECAKLSFALGSGDSHTVAVTFVALPVNVSTLIAAFDGLARPAAPGPPQYSPPDLFLKNSALLI